MNPDTLGSALRDSVEGDRIGAVPLLDIHRRARRGRLRATAGVVASAAVVSFLAVVAGSSLAEGRSTDVGPADSTSTSAVSEDSGSPSSDASSVDLPWSQEHLWDGDPNNPEALAGYTRLKDCPEALSYLQQPEATAYFTKYYGGPLGPEDSFKGGCPSIEELRRAVESLTPPSPPADSAG